MSNALKNALEHFARRKNSTIDVPEWGITVFYSPLSLLERQRAVGGSTKADDVAFRQARLVVEHAKDKDGNPLFEGEPAKLIEDVLHNMDPAIVDRIAVAILGVSSEADAAKN